MKSIKIILLTILFVGISIEYSLAQETKYLTIKTSTSFRNQQTKTWSDFEEIPNEKNILVTVDIPNKKIKIFKYNPIIYDIIKYEGESTDKYGDNMLTYKCIDSNNKNCKLILLFQMSEGGIAKLYVGYTNFMYVYYMDTVN